MLVGILLDSSTDPFEIVEVALLLKALPLRHGKVLWGNALFELLRGEYSEAITTGEPRNNIVEFVEIGILEHLIEPLRKWWEADF